jgi:RIO-like serine/threonine protein kinase
MVRHLNARLYASPDRFAKEFSVHSALWATGFPTVEPLGYGYREHLWGVEGVYLTRFADARPWPSCWNQSPRVVPELLVMLEALAAWGLHAPDLNATNVMLAADGGVLALDWDRARWGNRVNLGDCYRERLLRSLQKLQAPADVITSFRSASPAQRS